MSFTKTYGDTFVFAGHEVEVEFETLPGEAESLVRDYVRKGNHGQAEITVLGAAIQSLTVGGQKIIKKGQKKSGKLGGTHLPRIMDRTSYESLTDRLLKEIVKEEWWLAKKEPFDEVFAEYLEEDDEAPGKKNASNPTRPPAGENTDS